GNIDTTKGEFRKSNVHAGDTYFVNYDKVGRLTQQLVGSINLETGRAETTEDKLLLSFTAHFDFVSIHPFYDGNGRTARLLMNYLQKKIDLPLGIVHAEDRSDYINALKESRKKENVSYFTDFMFEQYHKTLQSEINKAGILKQEFKKDKGKGYSLIF
ncbi:MAG: Fic family protein, partial [Chitinophagaceae bacterium]|nr:Fic family protein [Chitinophagaceae bacterium]